MLSAASAESDRGSVARGVDLGSGSDSVCTVTGAAGFFGPSELVHSELVRSPPPALGDGLPLRAELMTLTCGTALQRAFVDVSSR